MAVVLNGKKLAQEVLDGLAAQVKSRDLDLRLAIVSVGQNSVSEKYQQQKQIACKKVNIGFQHYGFPVNIGRSELRAELEKIIKNPGNSGVVIQLPLPKNILPGEILNLIPPEKDIDCLGAVNFGRFCQGDALVLPPVVGAIKKLLEKYKIKISGKEAVVVGAGRLVGFPVSIWLVRQGATVTICNKFTQNVGSFTKKANIVISGVGQPKLIKGSMIKNGAIVIDCGTNSEGNRTVGDVETSPVAKKAGFLSPVPGGVGPLTIACLLENLVQLNKQ